MSIQGLVQRLRESAEAAEARVKELEAEIENWRYRADKADDENVSLTERASHKDELIRTVDEGLLEIRSIVRDFQADHWFARKTHVLAGDLLRTIRSAPESRQESDPVINQIIQPESDLVINYSKPGTNCTKCGSCPCGCEQSIQDSAVNGPLGGQRDSSVAPGAEGLRTRNVTDGPASSTPIHELPPGTLIPYPASPTQTEGYICNCGAAFSSPEERAVHQVNHNGSTPPTDSAAFTELRDVFLRHAKTCLDLAEQSPQKHAGWKAKADVWTDAADAVQVWLDVSKARPDSEAIWDACIAEVESWQQHWEPGKPMLVSPVHIAERLKLLRSQATKETKE